MEEKRLLFLTNDDGIDSHGLFRLAKAARAFGEVWIVAPASQCSAKSHSITLHAPVDVHPHEVALDGVRAFSCSGMPADCVRVGLLSILPRRPDVILSGINCGYNLASDIQYSATAGAAFEGSFQGVPSIAFSEGTEPDHGITDAALDDILKEALETPIGQGEILNINFPSGPAETCKGILRGRRVSASQYYRDRYVVTEHFPDGGVRLMVDGTYCPEAEEGTDFRAILDGFISIGLVNNIGYPITLL